MFPKIRLGFYQRKYIKVDLRKSGLYPETIRAEMMYFIATSDANLLYITN